jgi:hypothetical protein
MWVLAAIASASEPTGLADTVGLGSPDRHTALRTCGCVSLEWMRGGTVASAEVHRGDVSAVRHEVADDGHHELSLTLTDGRTMLLERAPCAVVAPLATLYAGVLEAPEEGSAVGLACPNALSAIGSYLNPRLVSVTAPDYGPMAAVAVLGRGGEPDAALQSAWSAQRPLLGRCFRGDVGPLPGRVVIQGRVARDGALNHLRVAESGPSAAVDACVLDHLAQAAAEAGSGRRFRAEIAWAPPAVSP